jgi:ribosomal protein S27AE
MDPAYFKPDDIKLRQCVKCGAEVEFWKDDVRMACDSCGTMNFNPDIGSTCLAWCEKAVECIGNSDIIEWKRRTSGGYSSRTACDEDGGTGGAGR